MLVANPDGYQYTFDHERLWRKNLRDNDGDGQITRADGVDLNRNYDERLELRQRGLVAPSSSSDTYRGTGPASEPEVQAHQALIDRLKFKFLVTYHSYGPLLLYPYGLADPDAVGRRSALRRATRARTRSRRSPASTRASGPTSTSRTARPTTTPTRRRATLSWTPELDEGCDGCGFVFPDDEALVQAEFEKNLPFALDLAKSAPDPATAGLAPREHGQAVLPRDGQDDSGELGATR